MTALTSARTDRARLTTWIESLEREREVRQDIHSSVTHIAARHRDKLNKIGHSADATTMLGLGGSRKPGSVAAGAAEDEKATPAMRCYLSPSKLVDGKDAEIPTVWELTQRSARLFPNHNGFGWRELIREHDEEKEVTKTVKGKEVKEKKTWKYFEMSDYKYMTYREILDSVTLIGSGLRAVGLEKGKTFNIYAATAWVHRLSGQFTLEMCRPADTLSFLVSAPLSPGHRGN